MTLTHTPAHATMHPDRFEDEATGLGYSVTHDLDAEDPRTWIDSEHAAIWAFRGPALHSSVATSKPEGNVAIDAFEHFFLTSGYRVEKDLTMTRRYMNIFHPEKKYQIATQTLRGYSQSEWFDVVAAVQEGYGTPEDHMKTFGQWAFGDVWTVIPDTKPGISGIYAEDAEEALDYFRKNYEECSNQESGNEEIVPPLGANEERDTSWEVSWTIDVDDVDSPAQATAEAWWSNFGRPLTQPSNEECCVFTITNRHTGQSVTIDLSDEQFAPLFTDLSPEGQK